MSGIICCVCSILAISVLQFALSSYQGDLVKAQIYLKPLIITSMSNSWKASLQQIIQNWMMTVLGLLKSGKLRLRQTIDQGDLIKLLGEGKKSSTTLCDRSGRPDNINSQEVARLQKFIMGNEETELELSVESRSFVNRVNDQVRKRQKRISTVAGYGEEHSIISRKFVAVTM